MILELLGIGVLGAIGKAIYDEGKKEQSSNNTIHNYQQQNNKQATPSSISQSDLQGKIRQLELNSNIGSIIDDNGCIYDIIFTPNTFKGFPNNMPKVNDQVMFTKQSVNGRLYASNIRYLATGDDIFNCMRTTKNSDNTIQSEPIKHVYQEKCEKDNNLNYYNVLSSYIKKYELRVYNPDRILEIHNQTNVDTDKIMADLERIFRALEKEKNTISPHVQPSNINYVVHSEPKHNNRNQSTASNNTKSDWEPNFVNLYEDIPPLSAKPYITSNFYISSYICPTCKNNMYKTVFRIGGEPIIKTSTVPITMKRLFTCPNCKTFYTPLPGQKLSQGMVYCKKCSSDYDTLLREYDYIGTTQGRPDA